MCTIVIQHDNYTYLNKIFNFLMTLTMVYFIIKEDQRTGQMKIMKPLGKIVINMIFKKKLIKYRFLKK